MIEDRSGSIRRASGRRVRRNYSNFQTGIPAACFSFGAWAGEWTIGLRHTRIVASIAPGEDDGTIALNSLSGRDWTARSGIVLLSRVVFNRR
jgi:hypothetical protein